MATPGWPDEVRARLDALFDALSFPTPTSFRFAADLPVEVAGMTDRADPGPLVQALWPVLYERCYARIFSLTSPGDPSILAMSHQHDPDFIARLSQSHTSRQRWDLAWKVYGVEANGLIHIEKGETFRKVLPGQYVFAADQNRTPRVGEFVDLLAPRESFIMQPAFYFALGEALGSDFDVPNVSRVYFHARSEGMPQLLADLSRVLNRHEVPFRLKCRNDPTHFDRADAAILFVPERYLTITLRVLGEIDETLTRHLKTGTPLFTRELRPGLGLADNPTTPESFGYVRSMLLAQGIADARMADQQDREGRHRAVADRFRAAGLDPSRPHLKRRVADPYRWPEGEPWPSRIVVTTPPIDRARPDPLGTTATTFLDVADRIGRQLCRDAIWSGGRCNWMAWTTEDLSGRPTPVLRSAPPGLADGVAGIALFLAHLQSLTGDRQQGIALGGAIRQLRATSNALSGGFQRGRLGVGYTLVALGEGLGDDILIGEGVDLMAMPVAPSPHDIVSDCAEAIITLLDVARRHDQTKLLDLAHAHGHVLLDHLDERPRSSGGLRRNAEIAMALLELDRASPEPRLRSALARVLDLDRQEHNEQIPADGIPPTSTPLWGPDTAGLGMLLLRLGDLLGDDSNFALSLDETIQAAIKSLNSLGMMDMSLGKGLMRAAEFLLQAAERLDRLDLHHRAAGFGRAAIERYHHSRYPWPCGVPSAGETPDLMLGTAGIGWSFLRLHEPSAVPSPPLITNPLQGSHKLQNRNVR